MGTVVAVHAPMIKTVETCSTYYRTPYDINREKLDL